MIDSVTMNPSLDRHVAVENLVLDDTNRWVSFSYMPGGKGINVSRVVKEMGGETMAYGFIGGIDGDILKKILKQKQVPCDFTQVKLETRSNYIITDLKTHRQTRISAPGPEISPAELRKLLHKITNFKRKPRYMVFAGSVPPGVPVDIYRTIIEKMKAMEIITVLDSADEWLREGVKALPDVIKPNVREAQGLLGVDLKTEDDIVRAVKSLVATGIRIVCISRGRDGMIIADKDTVYRVVPPDVQVMSTVGAGDSAVAGLVLKLSQGGTLEEASRLAAACGTAATMTSGTELCHKEDVEKLLPDVRVDRL